MLLGKTSDVSMVRRPSGGITSCNCDAPVVAVVGQAPFTQRRVRTSRVRVHIAGVVDGLQTSRSNVKDEMYGASDAAQATDEKCWAVLNGTDGIPPSSHPTIAEFTNVDTNDDEQNVRHLACRNVMGCTVF